MRGKSEALRAGRDAALARLRRQPALANPYRPNTKVHFYWQWGFDRADRLIEQVLEIGG